MEKYHFESIKGTLETMDNEYFHELIDGLHKSWLEGDKATFVNVTDSLQIYLDFDSMDWEPRELLLRHEEFEVDLEGYLKGRNLEFALKAYSVLIEEILVGDIRVGYSKFYPIVTRLINEILMYKTPPPVSDYVPSQIRKVLGNISMRAIFDYGSSEYDEFPFDKKLKKLKELSEDSELFGQILEHYFHEYKAYKPHVSKALFGSLAHYLHHFIHRNQAS